jgi:hypothetical protein
MTHRALALLFLAAPLPAAAQSTFNTGDYFPLAANSTWAYETQSVPIDLDRNFVNETVTPGIDIGSGRVAARIRALTNDPAANGNNDEQYWYLDPAGDLFIHGFRNFAGDPVEQDGTTVGTLSAQSVVFSNPVRLGGLGQQVGDTVTDTGLATIRIQVAIFNINVPTDIESTVVWAERLDTFVTPAGTFEDVLRVLVTVRVSGEIVIPFVGTQPFDATLQDNELFLAPGVGLVGQDFDPDPVASDLVLLAGGEIAGAPIVAGPLPPPTGLLAY